MTPLGNALANLRDHLLQVAAVMRTTPDATDRHRRHAGELDRAADICREWIEALENDND